MCGDQMRAIHGEFPFEAEVSFRTRMGVLRDEGKKKRAGPDLLADRLIPGVPAPQLALVEPHFGSR